MLLAMLFTLSDLQVIRSAQTPGIPAVPESCGSRSTNAQIQLLIRQWCLGLPVQPLLDADPQLNRLVSEVTQALPNVFKVGKRLQLHTQLTAPLIVNQERFFIQVEVNLGFRQGLPRLYEWALRKPRLNWSDRIKLWVASEHFNLPPEALKLVIVALHPTEATQAIRYLWSAALHRKTERSLITVLSKNALTTSDCQM